MSQQTSGHRPSGQTIGDMTGVSDDLIAQAVAWYDQQEDKKWVLRKLPGIGKKVRVPLAFATVDAQVLVNQWRYVRGDWGRLEVVDEVTITAHNRRLWHP